MSACSIFELVINHKNGQIRALLIASVLTIGTLCLIQYYLVTNTYKLEKDKYLAEIRSTIDSLEHAPYLEGISRQATEEVILQARALAEGKTGRQQAIAELNRRTGMRRKHTELYLKQQLSAKKLWENLKYKRQFELVVSVLNGRPDTLLGPVALPLVYIGKYFDDRHAVRLHEPFTTTYTFQRTDDEGKLPVLTHKLVFRQAGYADFSGWQKVSISRLAGIYMLAAGLLVMVIVLFFLIFIALIRQKKIAGIRTDFANNMSHELKTPLSSVSLILKSLSREEVRQDPVRLQEMLGSLDRQQQKIRHIVDSVLESAMVLETVLPLSAVEMTSFLQTYVQDMQMVAPGLSLITGPERVYVHTQAAGLEKVLNHLLENALKYCPDGSPLLLRAGLKKNNYRIELTDHGPGIAAAQTGLIFDKFYRVPEQDTHNVKGLGLGLYLSRQLVIRLGGTLTVKSKPGAGSTFIIKLPWNEN